MQNKEFQASLRVLLSPGKQVCLIPFAQSRRNPDPQSQLACSACPLNNPCSDLLEVVDQTGKWQDPRTVTRKTNHPTVMLEHFGVKHNLVSSSFPQVCQMQAVLFYLVAPCLSKQQVTGGGDHPSGPRGCLFVHSSSVLTSFPWAASTSGSSYCTWTRFSESHGEAILDQLLPSESPAHPYSPSTSM